jgi:hypothetical protein
MSRRLPQAGRQPAATTNSRRTLLVSAARAHLAINQERPRQHDRLSSFDSCTGWDGRTVTLDRVDGT